MTHPRQPQSLQLAAVPLQKLAQHLLRHVVAAVQVQGLQAGALPAGHPLGQHGVVHPVQLAGAEPGERGDPGEDLDDGGLGQVGGRDVHFPQVGGLLPLHPGDVVRHQVGLLEEEAAEVFAALDQDLQCGALHSGAVVDTQHRQLDTVGAEGLQGNQSDNGSHPSFPHLDMTVVHEADPPHVDYHQVGRGLLQGPDVEYLVHLALLLLPLLVGSVQVEKFHAVDKVVDFLHEVVEEDGLAETEAQVPGQHK